MFRFVELTWGIRLKQTEFLQRKLFAPVCEYKSNLIWNQIYALWIHILRPDKKIHFQNFSFLCFRNRLFR